MTDQNSLLVLDISSYGSALAIINRFCDDKNVEVFEVSPIGTAAVLILEIKDRITATLLKNEIFSFYKGSLLAHRLLEQFDMNLLKVYLSQNKPEVQTHLLVQEFSFISEAFVAAQNWTKRNVDVIDFRVIRTFPANVILTMTSESLDILTQFKEANGVKSSTVIERVEPILKKYFQIVQG